LFDQLVGPTRVFRALKHRNFRLFFFGQLISLSGTWMQSVAESWLVYRLTGSGVLLGIAAFCSQIPAFALAPVGGTVADRLSRHRIVIVTQTLSMVLPIVLGVLTLAGRVQVWHVLVLAALLGLVNAFDLPARQAFISEMVDKESLMNAVALNSAMFNGARAIGPAIAGVLVAVVGEGWCFLINGLSYVAVIVGLLRMDVPSKPRPVSTTGSAWRDTLEGFTFSWRTAPIRLLMALLGAVSFAGIPFTVLMPLFADSVLHGGPRGLGILMAASGVGAVVGALLVGAKADTRGLGRWVATSGVVFGVTLAAFAWSRTFWVSTALMVSVGAAMMVQFAASNTLLQAMSPDALRGRVMAVYAMVFMGMAPVGSLAAGWLADRVGAPFTVAIGGALSLVAAVAFATRIRAVRAEARELIAAQGLAAAPAASISRRHA
jgi:MFS family permease